MGQEINNILLSKKNIDIVMKGGDVGENKANIFNNSDVVIDFSCAEGLEECLNFSKKTKTPLVSGSTPMNDKLMKKMLSIAKDTKICWSANMSIGITITKKISAMLGKWLVDYDCEIIEKHHNMKKDAPSGTAIMLGKAVAESRGVNFNDVCVCDRHEKQSGARKKEQIGFSSVRGGSIFGKHKVMFIGSDDAITISHEAYNRRLFAVGAVECALKLLQKKQNGFYSIEDLLLNA